MESGKDWRLGKVGSRLMGLGPQVTRRGEIAAPHPQLRRTLGNLSGGPARLQTVLLSSPRAFRTVDDMMEVPATSSRAQHHPAFQATPAWFTCTAPTPFIPSANLLPKHAPSQSPAQPQCRPSTTPIASSSPRPNPLHSPTPTFHPIDPKVNHLHSPNAVQCNRQVARPHHQHRRRHHCARRTITDRHARPRCHR